MDISSLNETERLYWSACEQWVKSSGGLPRVNELYQQVGRGSLTTVVKVRRLFLAHLAASASVDFSAAAVPDAIRLSAQDLLTKLWEQAQREAAARWAQAESQLRAQLEEQQAARQALHEQLEHAQGLQQQSEQRIEGLTQALQEQELQARQRFEHQESRLQAAYQALQAQSEQAAKEREILLQRIATLETTVQALHQETESRRKEHLLQLDALRQELRSAQENAAQERSQKADAIERLHEKEIELVRLQQRLHLAQRQLQEQRTSASAPGVKRWKLRRGQAR